MKFEEINAHQKELIAIGEASEAYLKGIEGESDFLQNRSLFYSRLIRTISFFILSIFFVVLSNLITITRPLGKPYLTTQSGEIIKINEYKSVKR
jgi:hypothetical protein